MLGCHPKIKAVKSCQNCRAGPALPWWVGKEQPNIQGAPGCSHYHVKPTVSKFVCNAKLNTAHLNFYFYICREGQGSQDWM